MTERSTQESDSDCSNADSSRSDDRDPTSSSQPDLSVARLPGDDSSRHTDPASAPPPTPDELQNRGSGFAWEGVESVEEAFGHEGTDDELAIQRLPTEEDDAIAGLVDPDWAQDERSEFRDDLKDGVEEANDFTEVLSPTKTGNSKTGKT